jgi:hypothetical protein
MLVWFSSLHLILLFCLTIYCPLHKRGLSWYFTLIISWEQPNGQNPSLVTRAINHWTKPATSVLIIGLLSDLTRSRADLAVENALLRQQLIVLKRQIKRPQLTNSDRFRLVFLSHFTKFWKQALHIVQPDTLLRWHRELLQLYWRRKSQGKPKIAAETIALIQEMAKENQLWGAERIRGELLKLGIEVSKRTVLFSNIVTHRSLHTSCSTHIWWCGIEPAARLRRLLCTSSQDIPENSFFDSVAP